MFASPEAGKWGTLGPPKAVGAARQNIDRAAAGFRLRQATYAAGAEVAVHTHDRPSIVYGIGGPCVEIAEGAPTERRRLTFLPTGHRHALHYTGPTHVFVIEAEQAGAPGRSQLHQATAATPLPASLYDDIWQILTALHRAAADAELARAVGAMWQRAGHYVTLPRPTWIGPLLDRLHADWEVAPSATALARQFGFSPQYLCRIFKQVLGVTMKQYNRAIRVDYARGLLWGSGMPVSEIADATGFSDQSHLTRVVREHTGNTPVALRSHSFVPRLPLRHTSSRA